jgi:Holliday junction DNA helicase RuvA
MIAGVRGIVMVLEETAVVVDLHGFMVRVYSSGHTLSPLAVGDSIELRTHLAVREDALTLYGFSSDAELELFQLLLGVNGVGPRVALNLLSFDQPSVLYKAIANEDTAYLSRVPGVGKVTAGRIVFDLKRKLPDTIPGTGLSADSTDRDAIDALEALGYSTSEAREGLAAVEGRSGLSVEERVYAALQQLSRN